MIITVVTTTKPPIQAVRRLTSAANDPIGPRRAPRPRPNSAIRSGIDQMNRKSSQGIRNAPPPFSATILGKRQRLPAPTAMPIPATMTPQRDVKKSESVTLGGVGIACGPSAVPDGSWEV